MEREANEKYRAPALDKGLDILELLSEQSDGLTRTEIVKAMGRGPSEIYRMLERLVARLCASPPAEIHIPSTSQPARSINLGMRGQQATIAPILCHQGSGRADRARGSLRFTFGQG